MGTLFLICMGCTLATLVPTVIGDSFLMECRSPGVEKIRLSGVPSIPEFLADGEIIDNVTVDFYRSRTELISTEANKCLLTKTSQVRPYQYFLM